MKITKKNSYTVEEIYEMISDVELCAHFIDTGNPDEEEKKRIYSYLFMLVDFLKKQTVNIK